VAAPTYIGMEPSLGYTWDASPDEHPGRIARAWLNIMGGITLHSVYMRCSERWSPENAQLARHLGGLLKDTVGPWIVGGDWNMSPTELQDHQVFSELGEALAAPPEPTRHTVGGWRTYDYFVAHPALRFHVESGSTITDAPRSSHLAVCPRLKATVPSLVQRVPQQLRLLPLCD